MSKVKTRELKGHGGSIKNYINNGRMREEIKNYHMPYIKIKRR